eukprot:780595-Pelagomonas_calceolata.AAC.1
MDLANLLSMAATILPSMLSWLRAWVTWVAMAILFLTQKIAPEKWELCHHGLTTSYKAIPGHHGDKFWAGWCTGEKGISGSARWRLDVTARYRVQILRVQEAPGTLGMREGISILLRAFAWSWLLWFLENKNGDL